MYSDQLFNLHCSVNYFSFLSMLLLYSLQFSIFIDIYIFMQINPKLKSYYINKYFYIHIISGFNTTLQLFSTRIIYCWLQLSDESQFYIWTFPNVHFSWSKQWWWFFSVHPNLNILLHHNTKHSDYTCNCK